MGWITEVPRASVSFLFIYSPCLFFFLLIYTPPPPPPFFPIFNTLSLCPLSTPPTTTTTTTGSFSSLLSSLCLPREKRFCLLLVSAPSQSAFLISSYCFCLIFKCYPRPNGNPCTQKKEAEREGRKEKPAGYCVSLQDPETKPPPTPPHTPRERFGRGFFGVRVEVGGWV